GALLCGCSTVQSRKEERSGAYAGLSADFKPLVDQGRIKIGMPMDAVYIAWGKPAQVLKGESPEGALTTWVYQGTTYDEYRYWALTPSACAYGPYGGWLYLRPDYIPRSYVRAEVVFQNGVVRSWQNFARPY